MLHWERNCPPFPEKFRAATTRQVNQLPTRYRASLPAWRTRKPRAISPPCRPCLCCRRRFAIAVGRAAHPQPSRARQRRAAEKPRARSTGPAAAPLAPAGSTPKSTPSPWQGKEARLTETQLTKHHPRAFSSESSSTGNFATGVILHHSTKPQWTQTWRSCAACSQTQSAI